MGLTTKTPISFYMQNNQLYDAKELDYELHHFNNGILYYVEGTKATTREWEDFHGVHLLETIEVSLKIARTLLIKNGEIKYSIEHTWMRDQLIFFNRMVELLIDETSKKLQKTI